MPTKNRKKILALFGSNAWANLIYLASFVAMGAILNSVEFGAFRVAQAYISVAVSIAMLGLNTAMTHQFPLLNTDQQADALSLTRGILLCTSLFAGVVVYFLAPSASGSDNTAQGVAYFFSFPVAVAGASLCNLALSVYQAQGDLTRYAGLQLQWKTLVFLFGMAGSLLLQAQTVLIGMALAYGVVYFLQRKQQEAIGLGSVNGAGRYKQVIKPLFKSSIWPFAAICVSVIYSNVEFFYVDSTDLNSGVAGAYSLASLIYIGGAAFFMPLQTYAGSLVVNRQIGLTGLFKLQLLCFAAVVTVALAAFGVAHVLSDFFPMKFNPIFLDFAVLVCLKLGVWGSYAVVGSVLNYLDKGFESFILSAFCLLVLVLISWLPGYFDSLQKIVSLQIASNLIILVGCIYLVIHGHRNRSVHSLEGHNPMEKQ